MLSPAGCIFSVTHQEKPTKSAKLQQKKKLATHQVSTTTNSHPPLRQTERQAVKSSMDSPTEMVHAESVQKFVQRSSICKGLFVYWN